MIVRLLEQRDVASVVQLAKAMHSEAPCYRDFAFNPQKVEALCGVCLDNEDWLCIVTEADDGSIIGFTAAGAIETIFGPDRMVEDLAFYVRPESRGTTAAVRMLRMLETWAISAGAKAIRMGITTGTNPLQTSKFLTRFGYAETGWLYTKPVCPLSEVNS